MGGEKKIGVVIGSQSDFKLFVPMLEKLKEMEIDYEFTIASAHRTPEHLREWIKEMEGAGIEVIIAGAGGSAHLPGVVASQTLIPVIGVPLDTTHLRGVDALYSIVQMPKGVPVATVGINNVENAMLLALHILGIKYPEYRDKLRRYKDELKEDVSVQMERLRGQYPELLGEAEQKLKPSLTEPSREPKKEGIVISKKTDKELLVQLEKEFAEHSRRLEEEREKSAEAKIKERPKKRILVEPAMAEGERILSAERGLKKKPKIYRVDSLKPGPEIIEEAALTLLEGGIVAFPTDTVYGIGADATNASAVRRLYEIKIREPLKAIPVLIYSTRQLRSLVRKIPEGVQPVIDKFWPGALTIVFEKYENTFTAVSSDATIGVRIPDNLVCLSVLSMAARPLATTSANLSGLPPATTAQRVLEYFGDKIDVILDAGPTAGEVVSTVLSVVNLPFEILREGRISRAELLELLSAELLK